MINWKNELGVIRPEFGAGVKAFFTERLGGVSSGPWGGVDGIMGLNVGSRVGDNSSCVRMNRSIVADLCPAEPRWMTQVHGIAVVNAEDVTDESVQADAQITTQPETVCVVQVADCLPVLLADRQGRVVGAVRAGWKSLVAGVIEASVAAMRAKVPDCKLKAWLGPRIGFDDFEVGTEVADVFRTNYPEVADGIKPKDEKFCVDLAAYAKAALNKVGVEDIEDCALSTVADAQRFFSYRRDGEQTGRHAAVIWIEK